jgi:hypothetical protein
MRSAKRWHKLAGVLLALLLIGCGKSPAPDAAPETTESPASAVPTAAAAQQVITPEPEETTMQLTIGDTPVSVIWEQNESVEALKALVSDAPLTIRMSMYGGFEQVGPIGRSLPQNDVQTTTSAGDIVLYSGDQIVVFYGSNSWSYTRLGRITGQSADQLKALLGNGDVTVSITAGR